MSAHRIVISHEPFGSGYDITVEPALSWARFDQERPTFAQALIYAEALRIEHGWPILDQTRGSR